MIMISIQEAYIRGCESHNSADAMGVSPSVAAEIAICVGHCLSDVVDSECDAAYLQWIEEASKTYEP